MIRHPLIAITAVLSIGFATQALARSGAGAAGHGGASAVGTGAHAGAARAGGAVRGSVVAGARGYQNSAASAGYRSYGYGRYAGYGARSYSGGHFGRGAYGVAPFGTPTYVASGVFVPGNPTQTPIAPPAIYQIERTGAVVRNGRMVSFSRRPGIYPVGVSDGVQPTFTSCGCRAAKC